LLGAKLNLHKVLVWGSFFCAIAYLAVCFSPIKALSLVVVAMMGLLVSLLWPGTLSAASKLLPMAGASMFALLAAGGDIGASAGPWFVGVVIDAAMGGLPDALTDTLSSESFGLRVGMAVGAVFALISVIAQRRLQRAERENGAKNTNP
jgi:MFS family permease